MGIYYSSVGTRLQNYLKAEGLVVEDFAVMNPELVMRINHLGRKSKEAILERLEELNMKPGRWMGQPDMYWYQVLPFYKAHREEIRRENPIQYIEQPESEKPKDNWEEYRKKVAEDILMLLLRSNGNYPDPAMIAGMAVGYTNALVTELKKID